MLLDSTPETARGLITRQLRDVAASIRTSMVEHPNDVDLREPMWINHFDLLAALEALA